MAQDFTTEDGILLDRAGGYADYKVQKSAAGTATNGVLMLVGEAEEGPDYTLEEKIVDSFFGPDSEAAVRKKYGSGPLVDGYLAAVAPASDDDIKGAPNAIYLLKTNVSVKAYGSLNRPGTTAYGTLAHKSYGKSGNLIYYSVAADTDEVSPTTGSFVLASPHTGSGGATIALRVNGGSKQTGAIAANATPTTIVSTLNGLTGILATGGVDRGVLTSNSNSDTLALAVSGSTATITCSAAFTTTPTVGDILVIPPNGTYGATQASCITGSGNANEGTYVVTAATSTVITALKLRNAANASAVSLVAVSAAAISTDHTDILCYSPITIKNVTGTDRGLLTGLVGTNVTVTQSTTTLTFTLASGSWYALPTVGDLLQIPSGSAYAGGGSANVGWYTVTASTSTTISASRLSNGTPAAVSTTAIAATTDIKVLRPAIDGTGKALEVQDGAGSVNISTLAFTTAGVAVTWLSATATPQVFASSAEYIAELSVSRESDNIAETITAGGDIVLKLGYAGTTATATIGTSGGQKKLTTTVTGGTGSNLSITLKDFKTVSSLVSYINAQTGYTCQVGTTLLGQLPVTTLDSDNAVVCVLDEGTFGICSDFGTSGAITGSMPGRIKADAYKFFKQLSTDSTIVQLGNPDPDKVASGLPEVQSTTFLANGAKGPTLQASVTSAITACEKIRGNFLVTLFSRDATDDISDGLTDASSTYLVDSINAAVKTHVLKMSQVKRRRSRQGFVSKKGTFTQAKTAANNLASSRIVFTMQDVKLVNSEGIITQQHPWMLGVLAAATQAAGFYKSILKKGINCSGLIVEDGTFDDTDNDQVVDATKNGILVAVTNEDGGFEWPSDQTTYAADSNFVYNSIQAVYAADLVAASTAKKMEDAFVGQSLADISATMALAYLKGIMSEQKRLKLITGDDEAPLGFRNATVRISGNAMVVKLEIKLATALQFVVISFLVTEVKQQAAA